MKDIRKVLSYDDVSLVPRYSGCTGTSEANLFMNFRPEMNCYPIINSPMDTVCSKELIKYMYECGYAVTIHRFFENAESQLNFLRSCNLTLQFSDYRKVFISVGSMYKWKSWIEYLLNNRGRTCSRFSWLIDMANGDTKACLDTIEYIKRKNENSIIMAGNVATRSGFRRLKDAGANFIRVGIGGGSICSTRGNTAFGVPTLTSILDCADQKEDGVYLVADGGIEKPGDICKAIVAGADLVMCGKILAGTSLSAGKKLDKNFRYTKDKSKWKWCEYSGMASERARKKLNRNTIGSIEGVTGVVPYKGETPLILTRYLENLKTAMTYYGGCTNWYQFRRDNKFVEQTFSGIQESQTRIVELE